jgi:hypothetical protein
MYLKRILLILVVTLSGVVWVLINAIDEQVAEKNEAKSLYRAATGEIERLEDEAGREKAKAEAAYVSLETFKELNRKEFDELKKEIGNMRRLLLTQRIGHTTAGSVITRVDTVYRDSLASYAFSYKDEWLHLQGSITDSVAIDYQVRNELKITAYRKRDKWWKVWQAKKTFVNVVNLNPNTTTDSIQTYIVK